MNGHIDENIANTGICTAVRDGAIASIEVLAGPEQRRRWSIEQKQAVVAAAFKPGAVVRGVARQVDVTPSLIYRWRRDLRAAARPGFSRKMDYPEAPREGAPIAKKAQ
jgi:transposase